MLVKQISNIVNDSVKDALGKTEGITTLDSSDIVSMGKALASHDLYDMFFKSLTNRIAKTVYFVRVYEGSKRSVLRDEHEFGAFIQKTYTEMPDAVDNATWNESVAKTFHQASPYDVEATIGVSSLIFGGKGTWTIEIVRPIEQIKSAFLDNASMMRFIDSIYIAIQNSFKLEEERLTALAVNTSMASCLSGGVSRNLLAEYNAKHADNPLTVESALENADFLKFASKEINLTVKNMAVLSTAFNKAKYTTFTSKENLVVEMLNHFASASDMYLQADTFHNELTKLPNFENVPFWQSSGNKFDFTTCSSIDITNKQLISDGNETGNVKQSGIICFIHDTENVACYFGNRRTWDLPNPRSEVIVHGEKAEKGYSVDDHANAVVFYMA